jgi:hypothetical protein
MMTNFVIVRLDVRLSSSQIVVHGHEMTKTETGSSSVVNVTELPSGFLNVRIINIEDVRAVMAERLGIPLDAILVFTSIVNPATFSNQRDIIDSTTPVLLIEPQV